MYHLRRKRPRVCILGGFENRLHAPDNCLAHMVVSIDFCAPSALLCIIKLDLYPMPYNFIEWLKLSLRPAGSNIGSLIRTKQVSTDRNNNHA